MFNGMEVVTSLAMVKAVNGYRWEPAGRTGWRKRVRAILMVPRTDGLVIGGRLYVHPAMLPVLRETFRC
jgi:hypothetical protein